MKGCCLIRWGLLKYTGVIGLWPCSQGLLNNGGGLLTGRWWSHNRRPTEKIYMTQIHRPTHPVVECAFSGTVQLSAITSWLYMILIPCTWCHMAEWRIAWHIHTCDLSQCHLVLKLKENFYSVTGHWFWRTLSHYQLLGNDLMLSEMCINSQMASDNMGVDKSTQDKYGLQTCANICSVMKCV